MAAALNEPTGLAFNSAGDLFVANQSDGTIVKITPGGVQSTFASGLNYIEGLAFNSAGDLFASQIGASESILEFTPGGVKSTFATGLPSAFGLAFNSTGNLFMVSTPPASEAGQ